MNLSLAVSKRTFLGTISVFLLGVILLFNVVLSFGTNPVRLTVQKSSGGSLKVGGNLLVAGRSVRPGDTIRVLSQDLFVGDPPRGLRARFSSPSRWQHLGHPNGDRSLRIEIEEGSGRLSTKHTHVYFKFPTTEILLRQGRIHWTSDDGSLKVEFEPGSQIYFLKDGKEIPWYAYKQSAEKKLSLIERRNIPFTIRKTSPLRRRFGSLIEGSKALREIANQTANHTVPGTLLDVFGHWIRDRWGNIYLYRSVNDTLILKSAGPDGRFMTGDDRQWKASIRAP